MEPVIERLQQSGRRPLHCRPGLKAAVFHDAACTATAGSQSSRLGVHSGQRIVARCAANQRTDVVESAVQSVDRAPETCDRTRPA